MDFDEIDSFCDSFFSDLLRIYETENWEIASQDFFKETMKIFKQVSKDWETVFETLDNDNNDD